MGHGGGCFGWLNRFYGAMGVKCCEKKQSVSVVGGCWGLWGTAGGATDGA